MVLEATVVCLDNSEYLRNADYMPTRFDAQTDAVNLLCGAKTRQNVESSVGIVATAGSQVEVLVSPTTDIGKMLNVLSRVQMDGMSDLRRGIQTAQLALKHRQNKNQKQRIIAFVGSPVTSTDKELEVLGKNLKKNNVSIDLVSFGEVDQNTEKLTKLLNAANSNDMSHLVEVPAGPRIISDVLLSSPILAGEGGGAGGAGGEGAAFEFGADAGEDPELAMALRISMEEERARQAQVGGEEAPAAGAPTTDPMAGVVDDEDEALRKALALSMADEVDTATEPPAATPAEAAPSAADAALAGLLPEDLEDMDEDLRAALELSKADFGTVVAPTPAAEPAPPAAEQTTAPTPAVEQQAAPAGDGIDPASFFQDPDFVRDLLGSLPGVDMNDPQIQETLARVTQDKGEKGPDEKDGAGGSGGSGGAGGSAP
mmetsp:Transcript_44140/g.116819  ORF Transcript_44140/g.116819 Transcript_44140/m.116819 type:complete len:428 (-) Transcript_44140:292-1575(-)|eukprot:CAMPEP_0194511098 /NCGR_PEP_ID=MMETSP0253-20130528/42668_1 /TAXON_ID=2966 /ORGANISM="Noctiluca scintillans" /LENGTH=427 /DNA_ID=CAMNT_0039354407 /DNA_START=34 /DNA_END=1317 /DNA_ORIENTATION=+